MFCCTARSQKANRPTDSNPKAEADARAIKPHKPKKGIPTNAVSRNTSKAEETLPTMSLNLLKSESSNTTPAPTPYSLESVVQNTNATIPAHSNKGLKQKTPLVLSRNPQKGRRPETNSASSLARLKSASEKITPARSRSSQKQWSLVTHSVAQSSEITQALKHSTTLSTASVTLSAQLYTNPSHSELGTRAVTSNVLSSTQNTRSVSRSSEITHALKYSSTLSTAKVTLSAQLYTSPSHSELSSRAVTQSTSKRKVSLHSSTFLVLGNRSNTLTNAFANSTVKVVPSTQVNSRNVKSKNLWDQKLSSPMSHLRTQTILFSAFNQSEGNNHTKLSRETVAKIDDLKYCKDSKISHDVSPPNGTAVALGPVPDMRTCIHLSCDIGGDVAYMRSLHCFVITCDSTKMCQSGQMETGDVSSDIVQVVFLRKRGQFEKGRLLLFLHVRAPQYLFFFSL